jgi:acyl-CoA reductase-like NAD-dependent aldehyde dehydrogenase
MKPLQMKIGPEWRPGRKQFDTVDPYTGEPWASVPEGTKDDVNDAVAAARSAFDRGPWSDMLGKERAALMRRLADLIRENADELALSESRDNGKLLREMRAQMNSIPAWFDYFAGSADKIDGRVIDTGRRDYFGLTLREPVGVVAAILPWNSPLLLLTFKLAAALAAGCTIVAKPSEQAPVSILRLAELFDEAGFPAGVFNTVSGSDRRIGEWLVQHPDVDKVSFTGGETTGIAVARSAAEHLAPVSLELGGKSANIVFPDADVHAAVNGLIAGVFAAAGQTCIAGSRAFIHRSIYETVVDAVADRARSIVMGDPKDPQSEMGPICFSGQVAKIRNLVDEAILDGATVVAGGSDGGLGGLFYAPTVIADVRNDSRICREEVFGPVLAVLPFETEDEVVALSNDSRYGLAAGVWTSDVRRVMRMARSLRVGTVWVNGYRTLNYTMPFGGVKASGYGRENGMEGLSEFLRDKAIWIETSGDVRDPFIIG